MKRLESTGAGMAAMAVVTLILTGAGAAQADDAVILASCQQDLQLSDAGCACVLDKVHSELSDKQLAFFVAAISQDQPAMMAAQMELTGAEMMQMANFMVETPQQCEAQ
ncbi:MAG: hypothetical protein AAFO72_12390 [Pseudomonadota bacterium]